MKSSRSVNFSVRSFAFVGLAVLLACSCKNKSAVYSDDHLSPKVMQQVLKDVSIAEAYSTLQKDSLHRAGIKNVDSLANYYKDIFAHYNITEDQFKESLEWYKAHATDMDTLYSNLLPMINKMQAAFPTPVVKVPAPENTGRMPIPLPGNR